METAIVSLLCIALVVVGGMTMSRGFLSSVDSTSAALEEVGARGEDIMRTELATVSVTMPAANRLQVRLANDGQTKLASFSKWDVIIHYYDEYDDYYVKWLPHTANQTLNDNEWQKVGIYLGAEAEVFEPNIVNPGEEIVIEAQLNPAVGDNTTNLVVISTPNGIPASVTFSR